MKKYEKPILIALSLEGNERLCTDCSVKVKENPSFYYGLYPLLDADGDKALEKEDFDSLFGSGEGCKTAYTGTDYEVYCKFLGATNDAIAWS